MLLITPGRALCLDVTIYNNPHSMGPGQNRGPFSSQRSCRNNMCCHVGKPHSAVPVRSEGITDIARDLPNYRLIQRLFAQALLPLRVGRRGYCVERCQEPFHLPTYVTNMAPVSGPPFYYSLRETFLCWALYDSLGRRSFSLLAWVEWG